MNKDDQDFFNILKGTTVSSPNDDTFIVIPHKSSNYIDINCWQDTELAKLVKNRNRIKTIAQFYIPSINWDILFGSSKYIPKSKKGMIEYTDAKKDIARIKGIISGRLDGILRYNFQQMKKYVDHKTADEKTRDKYAAGVVDKMIKHMPYWKNYIRPIKSEYGNGFTDDLYHLIHTEKRIIRYAGYEIFDGSPQGTTFTFSWNCK